MASPSGVSLHKRRQSSINLRDDDGLDLARSLKQLSLSGRSPSRLAKQSTPGTSTVRGASPSPRSRPDTQNPSNGRQSRAGTPSLLRKASTTSLHSPNGAAPTLSRRASSAQMLSPSMRASSYSSSPLASEKPRLTANSIARNFLKADLEMHHGSVSPQPAETVVILNDAVYGHRFSRPRTSRSALSTIVERPERIKASVLGISAAYVRLGGRHSEGAFPPQEDSDANAAPGIPFRIHKTNRRLPLQSPAVTNVHGTKWMEELKIMCDSAETKLALGGKELQRPDMDRGPGQPAPEKFHEGDLYLCSESLEAIEGALGAVCEAIDTVFGPGPRRAFVGVRPPGHHCSASFPSGFCWVNNVHVGIMHAILNHGLTHAAIIDFDLHHGDGSQSIAWQHNSRAFNAPKNAAAWKKTSIGYFSLHDINSYPCEMGDEEKVKNASICIDNAHGQTVWNVHLQSWKTEEDFWGLYESKYTVLLEKVRSYLQNQAERLKQLNQPPKAAIFFSAGFDASEWESAGMQRHKVNVPTEFYARLAQDVIKLAAEGGLHVDGRVISVLEGGYSDRALFTGVFSHLSGLVSDQTENHAPYVGGLATEMHHKLGVYPGPIEHQEQKLASIHPYDPSWWTSLQLDNLDYTVANPPTPPKKARIVTPPTYCSPTAASTAKVVDPVKMRRSLSGLAGYGAAPPRSPTPPPPEVDWTVATYELSKLLIPTDRQVDSCKPEDLNAEATRVRRDRQSVLLGLPLEPPAQPERSTSRMSLRERRPKAAVPSEEEHEAASRTRRRTVGTSAISGEKAASRGVASDNYAAQAPTRGPRRLSEMSVTLIPSGETSLPPLSAGASRPTSLGARPTTSMSARVQSADSIPIKKTRTAATATAPPATTTSKVPRDTKKTTEVNGHATTTTKPVSKPTSPKKSSPSDKKGDEMDKITSGIRKIRINLITQTQKEARERARLEAERAAAKAAEERALSPTGTENMLASAMPNPLVAVGTSNAPDEPALTTNAYPDPALPTPSTTTFPSSELSSPIRDQASSAVTSPETQHGAFPVSSPIIDIRRETETTESIDIFIPYQPDGPDPVPLPQHDLLKWLPPNASASPANVTPVATPTSRRQSGLFRYTSGIPFAPQQHNPSTQTEVATQNVKRERNTGRVTTGSPRG